MSIIDELITDRTQSDVTHWQELHDKGWAGMTDEEKAEWNTASMKGAYNYTDLNRVTEAMDYLNDLFAEYGYSTGYKPIEVEQKTSVLPDGYTEIEYIQSSGSQYINTKIKPNQNSRVVVDATLVSQADASVGLFGVRDVNGANAASKFIFWSTQTGTQVRSDFFGTAANATSNISIIGKRVSVDKNKTICTVKQEDIDSVLATLSSQAATGQCTQDMYLFGVNTVGEAGYFCSAKLYSCQIYDNEVLSRHFIPCISPTDQVGLYDTVTNTFYKNSGSGNFIAGPTKVFTQLEYIQSSGSQYIYTGVNPNQDIRIDLKLSTSQTGSHTMVGSDISWTENGFGIGVTFAHYGSQTHSDLVLNDGNIHTVSLNKNVLYIDNVAIHTFTEQSFSVDFPIVLFANNRNGSIQETTALTLYSCDIYSGSTLIRHFIPCKRESGTVCLYDTVQSQFYDNSGTGDFVAGPEIEVEKPDRPTPYTWTESDVPTASQMSQYITNINALRETVVVLSTTPATPESMELFDYIRANDIEKILVDINQLIINMAAAWFYSGDLYSGEV